MPSLSNHLMIKIHRHPFQQREGWDLIKYPNNSKNNLYINDFYYVDVKFKYRKDIDIHKWLVNNSINRTI